MPITFFRLLHSPEDQRELCSAARYSGYKFRSGSAILLPVLPAREEVVTGTLQEQGPDILLQYPEIRSSSEESGASADAWAVCVSGR